MSALNVTTGDQALHVAGESGHVSVNPIGPQGIPGADEADGAPIKFVGTTTYTLIAGDAQHVIYLTNAAAVTVNLADIAIGTELVLHSLGVGGLSVAANAHLFQGGFAPKLSIDRGEALFLKQTGSDTGTAVWTVLGGTSA